MTDEVADWIKEKAAEHAAGITQAAMRESLRGEGAAEFYRATYRAILATISGQPAPGDPAAEVVEQPSAADIRKSVKPAGLVSFIDGRSYKTLKRHLTRSGLTPDTYRQRYGLPADYPMVCADYSAARSTLAKQTGLGQRQPAAE